MTAESNMHIAAFETGGRGDGPMPPARLCTPGWRTEEPIAECRTALHHRPFRLMHDLQSHPLFTVDALLRVVREAGKRPGDVYLDAGDVSITDKWGGVPVPDVPVDEVVRRIEHAGAWIVMKHVEADPAYAAVLNEWATLMRDIAGDGAHLLQSPEMLVFITSPNRITPFHFDAEVNVLVQIHGRKSLWVCSNEDRSIVSEQDIEHYYGVTITAGRHTPKADASASRYDLSPGEAIHIPTHSPHWVRNSSDVSVSLSLNFELPRSAGPDIYLANHYLRRLGITPRRRASRCLPIR